MEDTTSSTSHALRSWSEVNTDAAADDAAIISTIRITTTTTTTFLKYLYLKYQISVSSSRHQLFLVSVQFSSVSSKLLLYLFSFKVQYVPAKLPYPVPFYLSTFLLVVPFHACKAFLCIAHLHPSEFWQSGGFLVDSGGFWWIPKMID